MSLVKRTYVDGQTVITAQNLNSIQDEIIANAQNIEAVYTKTETNTLLSGKQSTILDLETIRSGAALGATALQASDTVEAEEVTLANVATSGSYNDLTNKPTNVSTFTNDAGYLTLGTLPIYDGGVV